MATDPRQAAPDDPEDDGGRDEGGRDEGGRDDDGRDDGGGRREAAAILDRLARDIRAALGPDLLGLYAYGSWTAGDFDPRRSDLDLLAVLAADPTEGTAATLGALHAAVERDEPAWAGRVDVEYLSVAALAGHRTGPRPMVRLSPGEPLHLTPATDHHLLNWAAARDRGAALYGPPAADLMPPIPAAAVAAVVRAHVAQWPEWVTGMRGPGGQAYAVLTLCRALHVLAGGGQVSKRAAGRWAAARHPEWAELIGWAERWWYAGGLDAEPGRYAEVERFVRAAAQLR